MVVERQIMAWTELRGTLARLYPNEADARRVAHDAGVPPERVDWSGSAVNHWQAVLDEASKHGLVDTVVAIAVREYPNDNTLRGTAQPTPLHRLSVGVQTSAPKFFVYVSNTKLDMLAPQLSPEVLDSIANSNRTPRSQQFAQLNAVVDLLRSHQMIGTVDEPKEYVEGILDMRWGQYGHVREVADGLVYFGGESERSIVGLGGSAKHVIGATGESHPFSHSATPALVRALLEELAPSMARQVTNSRFTGQEMVSIAVELATMEMTGPLERFEFIAKVLHRSVSHEPLRDGTGKMKILLATPLYVASQSGR